MNVITTEYQIWAGFNKDNSETCIAIRAKLLGGENWYEVVVAYFPTEYRDDMIPAGTIEVSGDMNLLSDAFCVDLPTGAGEIK